MLLGGTLTLQLSFNTLIYALAMCRTCFYPPKATEIRCHLQDLVCSRTRSHLPYMRGNESQLFSFTTYFTLIFILCSHSLRLSVLYVRFLGF